MSAVEVSDPTPASGHGRIARVDAKDVILTVAVMLGAGAQGVNPSTRKMSTRASSTSPETRANGVRAERVRSDRLAP